MFPDGGIENLLVILKRLLGCDITVWGKHHILYTTHEKISRNIEGWPLVKEGKKSASACGIYAPGEHELCRSCMGVECNLALELFFPFVSTSEWTGGICYQFPKENYSLKFSDSNLTLWIEFLNIFTSLVNTTLLSSKTAKESLTLNLQLNSLLELIPEGVVLLDEEKNVIKFNKAAGDLVNVLRDQYSLKSLLPDLGFKSHFTASHKGVISGLKTEAVIQGSSIFYNKEFIGGILYTERETRLSPNPNTMQTKREAPRIIGSDPALLKVLEITRQAARSDSTVLIRGESGTGKELFARTIHSLSSRAAGPFVAINCAAIPESLLESELFGYEEGSFTGAKKGGKPGKFEMADKGTLFLDEIGDMPLSLQAKLLRVLQEKRIDRVGSIKPLGINVRLVAATHRNLEDMIVKRTFREDLFFRLSVIPLFIPPLRERVSDIEILLNHYLRKYCVRLDKGFKIFSFPALKELLAYDWPGNVRELENMVEYLVNIHNQDVIREDDLPIKSYILQKDRRDQNTDHSNRKIRDKAKDDIIKTLNSCGWDTEGKKRAAISLGISVATLYRWMNKYKIEDR